MSPPSVLAVLPGFYPSTIIGVSKPLQRLHGQGSITLDLALQALVSRAAIARADVVVLCGEAHPRCRQILDWIREAGRPLVYEIDDNRLEIPPEIPGLDYARHPAQRELVLACIRQADVVRVYSPVLQEFLRPHNARTELVDGPLDWSLIPPGPIAREAGTVRIVYATSRQQDSVSRMVVEPLQRALAASPRAELTIWGPSIGAFERHPQVRHRPFIRNYDRFFKRFARGGFDIGLAPLPDDLFHRCKSNNKFREYAASGVAGIYSDMPVYNTCVVHGRTGLLVGNDPESWFASLMLLINDAPLRAALSANARDEVRRRYNETVTGDAWLATIHDLAARPQRVPAGAASPAPAPDGPLAMIGRLVAHAMQLGKKAVPALRQGDLGGMRRRTVDHAVNFAHLAAWGLRRRHRAARPA